MNRFVSSTVILSTALLLPGCDSREPMDYLPDCPAYLCVNSSQIQSQAGAKRLTDAMRKINNKQDVVIGKSDRTYLGLANFGPSPNMYGVMTGQAGYTNSALNELKNNGGVETKIDGRRAVTINDVCMVELSETALLLAGNRSDYETMARTAKKKNPAAIISPLFMKLNLLAASHALCAGVKAEEILAKAGPSLGIVESMDQKGAEALKQVKILSVTMDWDKQPQLVAVAHMDGETGKNDLARLANLALAFAKTKAGDGKSMFDFVKHLEATTSADGVTMTLDIPKDIADPALDKIEKLAAGLPADPAQRQTALQAAMTQFLLSMPGTLAPRPPGSHTMPRPPRPATITPAPAPPR
ncbi:MAG: hypothetical protein NTY46_16330 [Candidatus Sumerlaeota bacterium]|nr:hypothetical protein [Candidatus Sumerlaeota bacterium]